MKMNKLAASILAAGIALGAVGQLGNVEAATKDIKVVVNGFDIPFINSTKPRNIDGIVYVPMRNVFENAGANVSWYANGKERYVKIERDKTVIQFYAYKNVAVVNGKDISDSVPMKIIDGQSMIPLRYVGETIGASVSWDNKTKTATINTK